MTSSIISSIPYLSQIFRIIGQYSWGGSKRAKPLLDGLSDNGRKVFWALKLDDMFDVALAPIHIEQHLEAVLYLIGCQWFVNTHKDGWIH